MMSLLSGISVALFSIVMNYAVDDTDSISQGSMVVAAKTGL